jgi:hypothetical protein
VCKSKNQVHLISIQDEDTSGEESTEIVQTEETSVAKEGPEHQISMHALSGTSSHAKTFPLFIHMGKQKWVALVDTGGTTSFIDPSVIQKLAIQVDNHDPLMVTMANGNILWTHAITSSYSYTI